MEKQCKGCKENFTVKSEDIAFYEKMQVITPSHCPDCRQQRRLAYNNEMKLYNRKCDYTGKQIISVYSPDKPYQIYSQDIWWSDKWDPLEYGQAFDFSRPFFEQFFEVFLKTPHKNLDTIYLQDENSQYTNYAGNNKNCYLIFHANNSQDCYYGYGIKDCKNCVENFNIFHCELCYECIDCYNCYDLKFSQNCHNCSESYFLKDCRGCKNCIGCKNLNQKEYYIFNKPYSKEEYQSFLKKMPASSHKNLKIIQEQIHNLFLKLPYRFVQVYKAENCFGDNIYYSKNISESFDVSNMEDGKYCYQLYSNSKDCMDVYQFGINVEGGYDCSCIGSNCTNMKFCHLCYEQVHNLTYCYECHHSTHLFGCVGIKNKKYCILNKQYTKEEYESLIPKIIEHMIKTGEWGEFFPMQYSPFAYNETMAQNYFPLTKKECQEQNLSWQEDTQNSSYEGPKTKVPDDLQEVEDNIISHILNCETCGKNYRIISQELEIYKKMNLALPRNCMFCRNELRMQKRNPRKLYDRNCMNCNVSIKTTFSPQRKEIVYCEKCYQENMI